MFHKGNGDGQPRKLNYVTWQARLGDASKRPIDWRGLVFGRLQAGKENQRFLGDRAGLLATVWNHDPHGETKKNTP